MPDQQPSQTLWIDLSLIDIPSDAREHDPEKLKTLAQDMKEQGQLQEIVVTETGAGRETRKKEVLIKKTTSRIPRSASRMP